MDAEEYLGKRIKELAEKSYQQSIYLHTNFLSLAEQSLYYSMERELSYAQGHLLGGHDYAERKVILFGSKDLFGYEGESPICCLHITPLAPKFSEKLNHRDYLGSIMNLGIEREYLGDILVLDDGAYLFCIETMADYLEEQITKIRHTLVQAKRVDFEEIHYEPKKKAVEGFVSSFRIDAIIALGFALSRKDAQTAITSKRVFINGKMAESTSKPVNEGDLISVRGLGKMEVAAFRGMSKKGRHSVLLERFI